ncbi:hypothetical protein [Streptomyces endophyticus]|uniref:Condensation domain-containing protein n=1 Tax=Streptomyces endophyticus TaxID=714166 RepID=A0ABU6FED7_9ACTN|nr:hypothetical protein [Streptomyces endophyticus]MEB8341987.1 hypothetical protein [Streptomyces endophyticus]
MRQLGADPDFIDMVADELLPAVTEDLPSRPAAFGTVLAHSASTWWRPGMTALPGPPDEGAETWLYEQAAAAPVGDVCIRMDVGSNEGAMVDDLLRLHALIDGLADTLAPVA